MMCPYSAREEMTSAVRDAIADVQDGIIMASWVEMSRVRPLRLTSSFICRQVTAQSIQADLYTSPNALRGWHLPEPDILVRTSGVSRLSDFLLWQVSSACMLPSDMHADFCRSDERKHGHALYSSLVARDWNRRSAACPARLAS